MLLKPIVELTKAQKRAMAERLGRRGAPQLPVSQISPSSQPQAGTSEGLAAGLVAGVTGRTQMSGAAPLVDPGLPQSPPGAQDPLSIQPGTDPSQARRVEQASLAVPEASELASHAAIASQLWKDMGGEQSLGAKLWEMYKQESKASHGSARDYFISSFVRWRAAPQAYEKANPREARILQSLAETLEGSLQLPKQMPAGLPEGMPPRPAMGGA